MAIDVKIQVIGDEQALSVFDKLSDAEKERKQAFEQANNAYNQQKITINSLKAELAKLTAARNEAFDEKEIKKLNQEIQKTEKQLQDLQNKGIKPAGDGLNNIGGIAKRIGGFMVAAFAVDKIISFGKEVLNTTATFQKFEAVLTNTLGSRSEAQKALQMINQFAATTPFAVEELTGSFVKLANAGFQPTAEEMRKLGDLASAFGKSFDQLTEGILDAQTFQFERLKEFGIKAEQSGNKVAFTFKGVTTEVDKTSDAVKAYILSLGDLKGVSGGMEAVSKTLEGQISNLGDAFGQLQQAIGNQLAGAFSAAIGATSELVGWLKDLVETPVEDKIEAERVELNALVEALISTNEKSIERSALISEITAKYPDFVGQLNLNTASEKELRRQLAATNEEYTKRSLLASAKDINKDFDEEQAKIIEKIKELRVEIAKTQAGEAKQGLFGIGGKITDPVQIQRQVKTLEGNIAYYETQLKKLEDRKVKAEISLARANIKGGENMTDKQVLLELKALEERQKLEEEIFKTQKDYQEQLRKQAEIDAQKKREADEKARKKAEEEAKKAAEERAKQEAELRLRELQAQQIAEQQKLKNLIAYQREQLNNENLSAAEKIALQKRIGENEIRLLEVQNAQKKTQYEIDKNSRVQIKKLTATELKNIDEQTAFEVIATKQKTQKEIENTEKDSLEKRKKALDEEMKARLSAMEKDVQAKREAEEKKLQAEKEAQARRREIFQAAFNLGVEIVNAGFEIDRQQNEAKLANLQAQKEAELKIAGDSEQAKAIVQAKFAQEERKLKEGQARAEKNKALFDIAINTALAISKAIAASPATFGLPFSAFALAQGAIQAAVVASRPIPKFREGVEYLQGKGTTTSDSNLAWLSKGERVVDAETNKKYFPVLSAIHNHKISPDLLNSIVTNQKIKPETFAVKQDKQVVLLQKEINNLVKALAKQPRADVSIDKNGFSVFLSDSLEKQKVLNNRYSL
ncbi:MAG: hypothetical protein Fur0027_07290 [Raineya sp.]